MISSTKNSETAQELRGAANTIKNEARDTVYDAKNELRSAANRTGRRVREFIDTASDELHHVSDSVGSQIRSNPVQSSLIALGAGFILGALFRR